MIVIPICLIQRNAAFARSWANVQNIRNFVKCMCVVHGASSVTPSTEPALYLTERDVETLTNEFKKQLGLNVYFVELAFALLTDAQPARAHLNGYVSQHSHTFMLQNDPNLPVYILFVGRNTHFVCGECCAEACGQISPNIWVHCSSESRKRRPGSRCCFEFIRIISDIENENLIINKYYD